MHLRQTGFAGIYLPVLGLVVGVNWVRIRYASSAARKIMHYALCIDRKTPKIKKVADTHVQATLADETFNYSFIASFILSYFLFRNQMMP